jgi:hypothetical protein
MVAHDHIELPPIRPVITRIHRHRGVCPACQGTAIAYELSELRPWK